MDRRILVTLAAMLVAACLAVGGASPSASGGPLDLAAVMPQATSTAGGILAKSVAAHGGDKLIRWQTLTIKGTVRMEDGISYNAAFLLRAQAPGRIRVDQDMTADHGRLFYEYFMHDGVAWSRRNLVVASYDTARMQRWMDHCSGIAFYAHQPGIPEMKPDADVTWKPTGEAGATPAPQTRRTFVLAVTVGKELREIYIDKETSRFLKETTPSGSRVFSDFKTFGGVVWPTRILETAKTRQGESQTPFVYTSVTYNTPIDAWVFTEDKPAAKH
ncbi:MAG: hypothetical protein NTV05_17095 [Acidobacteria bacterium]|nr:hypothetical protein [Acidobacteriota bacterium]